MRLDVTFVENNAHIDLDFGDVQEVTVSKDNTLYTGDYFVTPTVNGQILPTADRLLVEDMTINPIPYYDVGNLAGGSTVYIGKELD